MWTQIILPYPKYQIIIWIPVFGIDSPLTNAGDLRNLWSYVSCKGVQMIAVADRLYNSGFNTIVKSSLLNFLYSINQEKTLLQIDITATTLSLFLKNYFALSVHFSGCI